LSCLKEIVEQNYKNHSNSKLPKHIILGYASKA
jgi:hypothetical protein